MFNKYDEIMEIFNNYLLNKINGKEVEAKGIIQTLRKAVKNMVGIDLPIIMEDDKQLIYSVIISYLEARRTTEIAYRLYHYKNRTCCDHNSEIIKEAKIQHEEKLLEFSKEKVKMQNMCETYVKALCVSMYDGELNIDVLKELKAINYDCSYGSDNLKLMYQLYTKSLQAETEISDLKKDKDVLYNELAKYKAENAGLYRKNLKLEYCLKVLEDELSRINILNDYYKNELKHSNKNTEEDVKSPKKLENNPNGYRIYGK